MRFLQKSNYQKVILVLSDLHLGAGAIVKGKRNVLEDFHFDHELVEFLEFYSSEEYQKLEVELIINGDFLDFLAVPYVEFFDDEFWSEKAALEKLKLIVGAHQEVFQALRQFLSKPNKSILYMIGNHDAEMLFVSAQKYLLDYFQDVKPGKFKILGETNSYRPLPSICLVHGHEYERAHQFDAKSNIIQSSNGENYFLPPWGSYYVIRVINRFKEERSYVNTVRPLKTFFIYGLIFDPLISMRFIFANLYYLFMVRFLYYFKQRHSFKEMIHQLKGEMELFQDYEKLTQDFFVKNPDTKVLIVGHTHEPTFRQSVDGSIFINTGTWTKITNLDLAKRLEGYRLTYCQVNVKDIKNEEYDCSLNIWRGLGKLPYTEFQ